MKIKRKLLMFLEDNATMINSLMSSEERRLFRGDVVVLLENEIKKQIKREENCNSK